MRQIENQREADRQKERRYREIKHNAKRKKNVEGSI
jgi:hypothetical protein